MSVITEAAQGTSFYEMVEYQKQVADDRARESERGGADVDRRRHRRLRPWAARTSAQLVVRLKPRSAAQGSGERRSSTICGRKLDQVPGMKVYLQNPPTIQIGGQVTKSLYQFSMQSPNKPELFDERAKAGEGDRGDAGHRRRHQRSGHHQSAGERRHRPRQGRGAAGERQRDRKRVLRRLRPALGVHDLRRHQRIQSAAGTGAAISGRSAARCRCCTSRAPNGPADSARHAGQDQDRTSARRRSITSASCRRSRFRST